ncbi:MAG: hypothetical protein AMXMBFR7_20940 [Planctomycetota bacterium]
MNGNLRKLWLQTAGRPPRGTALIVAMVIVMLLTGLATSLLLEMQSRSERTEADSEDIKAFEAAEAGLDAAIRSINTGGTGTIGIGWNGDGNSNGRPDSGEVAAGGWHVGLDGINFYPSTDLRRPKTAAWPNQFTQKNGSVISKPRPESAEFDFYTHSKVFGDVRYFTYAHRWEDDGIDNDGVNGVDDPAEREWYTIYSTGFSNPATPDGKFITVEAIARRVITSNSTSITLDAALELQIAPFQP